VLFAREQPWMFPIRNLKNIGHGVAELSMEVGTEYLIAYRPNKVKHDRKWRKIRVRVTPPQNSSRLRV